MGYRNIKILYVEDDEVLSFVTIDNLEREGFTIVHAGDGLQALEFFNTQDFDLCIVDIMLPKLDGFSFAKKVREKNPDIPIIFLTAKSLKEDKLAGLRLGADDYITKPFSIEELILKIEIFIKRSKVINDNSNLQNTFEIGQYTFDFSNLVLKIDNEEITLTLKEGELLKYFCMNQNKLVKREDILTNLWGKDDYFLGRSMDVFISRLRKYLQRDNKIAIENIHKVGFRLMVE